MTYILIHAMNLNDFAKFAIFVNVFLKVIHNILKMQIELSSCSYSGTMRILLNSAARQDFVNDGFPSPVEKCIF